MSRVALARMSAGLYFVLLSWSIYLVYARTLAARGLDWNTYAYSDLLINYRGGFVRRGLIGQLIYGYSGQGSMLHVVNEIAFVSYVVFCLLTMLLTLFSRGGGFRNLLLVLLLPGGAFSMALGDQVFFRKEIFFYNAFALVALLLLLVMRIRVDEVRRWLEGVVALMILVCGVVLPFVHEAFLFLSAPASALLLNRMREGRRVSARLDGPVERADRSSAAMVYFYLGLGVAIFVFLSFVKGNRAVAEAIWHSLNVSDRLMISPEDSVSGGIGALSWGVVKGISMSVEVIASGMIWYWLTPMIGGLLYCLTFVSINMRESRDEAGGDLYCWLILYLALGSCTLPLFLLGWDWGRWLIATNIAFTLLYLATADVGPRMVLPSGLLVRPQSQVLSVIADTLQRLSVSYYRLVARHRVVAWVAMILFAVTCKIPEGRLGDEGGWLFEIVKQGIRHHHATFLKAP